MAKYTIELDTLLKANFDMGLKDYPIFDESYRTGLNIKILEHYRFYEIGQETPARFVYYLNRTMTEIMPLYNQYYESAKLDFNPLYTKDYTETSARTIADTTTTTNDGTVTDILDGLQTENATDVIDRDTTVTVDSDSTSTIDGTGTTTNNLIDSKSNLDAYSETPQSSIENLENYTYLSNARKVTETDTKTGTVGNVTHDAGTSTNDTTTTTADDATNTTEKTVSNDATNTKTLDTETKTTKAATDSFTKSIKGFENVAAADLLNKYRSTFLNIDMMVISALSDCFMMIY